LCGAGVSGGKISFWAAQIYLYEYMYV